MKKELTKNNLIKIKEYLESKSWWDSVDAFHNVISHLGLNHDISTEMLKWSKNKNLWTRRISIIHQLHRKDKTDIILLEKIVKNNFHSTEFFINKAIGWALRGYSKINPNWVKNFIDKNLENMSKFSILEGNQYIK